MAHVVGVPRRDPCHKCKLPVFLAERLTVGKKVYHRRCLKCARCGSQLTPGSFYETEIDDQFCCETCPDEEIVAGAVAAAINSEDGGDSVQLRNGIGSPEAPPNPHVEGASSSTSPPITSPILSRSSTGTEESGPAKPMRSSIAARLAFFEQNKENSVNINQDPSKDPFLQRLSLKNASDEDKSKSLRDAEKKSLPPAFTPYKLNNAMSSFLYESLDGEGADSKSESLGSPHSSITSAISSPWKNLSEKQLSISDNEENELDLVVNENVDRKTRDEKTSPRLAGSPTFTTSTPPPRTSPARTASPKFSKLLNREDSPRLEGSPTFTLVSHKEPVRLRESPTFTVQKELNLQPSPRLRESPTFVIPESNASVYETPLFINEDEEDDKDNNKDKDKKEDEDEDTNDLTKLNQMADVELHVDEKVLPLTSPKGLEDEKTNCNLDLIDNNILISKGVTKDQSATASAPTSASETVSVLRCATMSPLETSDHLIATKAQELVNEITKLTKESLMDEVHEQADIEDNEAVQLRDNGTRRYSKEIEEDKQTIERLSVVRARLQQFEAVAKSKELEEESSLSSINTDRSKSLPPDNLDRSQDHKQIPLVINDEELLLDTKCNTSLDDNQNLQGDLYEKSSIADDETNKGPEECKEDLNEIKLKNKELEEIEKLEEVEENLQQIEQENEKEDKKEDKKVSDKISIENEIENEVPSVENKLEKITNDKEVTRTNFVENLDLKQDDVLADIPSTITMTSSSARTLIPNDPRTSSKISIENYPKDLDPFKSDSDEDDRHRQQHIRSQTMNTSTPRSSASAKNKDLNPFDSSDDEIELEKAQLRNSPYTQATNSFSNSSKVPPPRPPPPRLSRNPFSEDTDEENNFTRLSTMTSSYIKRTPVPTPRRNISKSQNPTPEPTPRLSSKVTQSANGSEYFGSENSLCSTATTPLSLQRNSEIRSSNNSLSSSFGGTMRSRKTRRAPLPPSMTSPSNTATLNSSSPNNPTTARELFPSVETLNSSKTSSPSSSARTSPKQHRKKRPAPAPPKPARLDPSLLPQITIENAQNNNSIEISGPKNLNSYPLQSQLDSKFSDEEKALLEGKPFRAHRETAGEVKLSRQGSLRIIPLHASLLADHPDHFSESDDLKQKMQHKADTQVVYKRVLIPPNLDSPTHEYNPIYVTLQQSPANDTRQIEKLKDNKEAQNRNRQSQNSSLSNEDDLDSSLYYDKASQGKWKRRKGPAPALPIPPRKVLQMLPLQEIKHELEIIEVQQQGLEKQGVILEKMIRDRCEGANGEPIGVRNSVMDEYGGKVDVSGSVQNSKEVEDLILQLFELVNEKNELFRRQAELMYLRRQHRLEQEQADLEYEIRVLMAQPERNKTDTDKAREEALIARFLEVVRLRNEVIESLEMDRLREAEEDLSIKQRLELHTASRMSSNSPSESGKVEKLSKKEKKKQKETKKLSKNKKIDVDKDADETELENEKDKEKTKKKKKFLFLGK